MKLIYTGSGTFTAENWLYNCTRNAACQRAYYMPIKTFNYLILFLDFPFGQPDSVSFYAEDCNGNETQLFYNNYVIAQRPGGAWYGVFTEWITAITDIPASRFYIKAVAALGSTSYKYLTNQFENNTCDRLTKLSSCYNDTETTSDASDCNNVYYGYPAGNITIGNPDLRYYHNAYVRDCEVNENKNKFQFTFFNSLKAYKNYFTRNYALQFELVPGFYKDILIGILNRGNIQVNDVDYSLEDSQDIALADDDLKFWKVDLTLYALCKQFFSCTPTICTPKPFPPPTCEDNFTTAVITDNGEGSFSVSLTGGSLSVGDSIEWQVLDADNNLLYNGTATDSDFNFTASLDTVNNCYTFKWRKLCTNEIFTAYITTQFGNCGTGGGDCKTCGDNFIYDWASITYHMYDDVCINVDVDKAVSVAWDSYDRPNRFTIYDGATFLTTSGWVGYAPYAGPWGTSLSTAESGSLDFAAVAGHVYTLRVEAGNGDPQNFLSDGAGVGIICDDNGEGDPPPVLPKVTSSSVVPFNFNVDTGGYNEVKADVILDSSVDIDTSFVLYYTYTTLGGSFTFFDIPITVIVSAGNSSGTTYGGFSNQSAGGGCVHSCDNINVDLNGHEC